MVENESVYDNFATNSIQGSTLTLAETTVILVDGVWIDGKTIHKHLDTVDAQQAYPRMLELE